MEAPSRETQRAEEEAKDTGKESPQAVGEAREYENGLRAEDCPRARDFDPDTVAHVPWEDLIDPTRTQARAAFTESLHKLGFAFLALPDSMMGPLERSYEAAREFFADPEKVAHKMGEQRDVGYINIPHVKEFYQMRYTKSPAQVWPARPANFKEVALEYHDLMLQITKECFRVMAEGLQVDAEHLLNLLDLEERAEAEADSFYGSTLFRYFRYKNKPCLNGEEPCKVHTDIGLITIIPVTSVPQLQMLHNETFEWIDVEPLAELKNEVIVFCGEMMERLTMYWYRAIIHRVCPPAEALIGTERYSLVYLCRARPDAILDTATLNSPVVGTPYWEFTSPISVAEFMRQKYVSKESANGLNTMQAGGVGFPSENVKDTTPSLPTAPSDTPLPADA